jgi:hypothetical protein
MPSTIYSVYNTAVQTTATPSGVATGTAVKTLLQGTAASTKPIEIVSWSIEFDTAPIGRVELIHTTTVAGGTPTAVVPTLVTNVGLGGAALSTWGFSPATEGTVVATVRVLDMHQVTSAGEHVYWFPPEARPVIPTSGVVRVRVTMATGANAIVGVDFTEI